MTSEAPDLSAPDVDGILAFLRHERSALTETRAQRLSFRALQWCTLGYVVSGLLLVPVFTGRLETDGPMGPGEIASFVALVLFCLCFLASVVLLPVNLFLMRRLRESMRLLRRFGIQKALEAPWRMQGLTPTLGNALSSIGFLVGGLWLVLVGFGLVGLVIAALFGESIQFRRDFVIGLLFATPGLVLIAYYLIQRARLRYELLADVNRLEALLTRQKRASASGAAIEIDPLTRRQLGVIEQAKIRRERVEAISASLAEGEVVGYSVLRSVRSAGSAAQLGVERQARAEFLIQQLSRDPKPEAATPADAEGVRTLADHETGVGIRYMVDDASRTVRVLDIVQQT